MRARRDPPEPSVSVFVQPALHGPWTNSNNFGAEVAFTPDEQARQRIIKLPEWGDPVVWTVSLGIEYTEEDWPLDGGGRSRGFEIVGEVSYGVGGATQTVEVDWVQGTTFSVPMNAISVDAAYIFPFGVGEGPEPQQPRDLRLSVLLARGGASTSIAPTKLAKLLDGSSLASLVNNLRGDPPARIPKFGRRVFLQPAIAPARFSELVSGNNYLLFFSAPEVTAAATLIATIRITSSVLQEGVRVPPFAKYVTLENAGGGLTDPIPLLFNFELQL